MAPVFFDIDTQIDFLYPAGALYVPGAERIAPAVSKLNRFAAAHRIPVVSTMCAHDENDAEFRDWPPHCITGTTGQNKPQSTLLARRATVPNRKGDLAIDGAEQILLEKQQLNLFTNPNLPALLERLAAEEYVVYGVVTEYCVRFAAMGLLETGKPVTLVSGAIQALNDDDAARVFRDFTTRGGQLASVSEICGQ